MSSVDKASTTPSESHLEWIQIKRELTSHYGENQQDKLSRKIRSNPILPIGCLATVGALGYGLWSFRKGRPEMSQKMMRLRIAAQGFTVIALAAGVVITNIK